LNKNPEANKLVAGVLWGDEGESMLQNITHKELIPTLERTRFFAQTSVVEHAFYEKNLRGMANVDAVKDDTLVELVCSLSAAQLKDKVPEWHNRVAQRVENIEFARKKPNEYVQSWIEKIDPEYRLAVTGVNPQLLLTNGINIEIEHVKMNLSKDNKLVRNRVADFMERNGKYYEHLAKTYEAEAETLTGEKNQSKLKEAEEARSNRYAIGISVANAVYQSLEKARQDSEAGDA